MNLILIFLSIFFILLSGLGFFYSSEKQRKKTLQSKLMLLAKYNQRTKIVSAFLFLISLTILFYVYDYSIGFISLWIISTPVFLSIILIKNDLSPLKK